MFEFEPKPLLDSLLCKIVSNLEGIEGVLNVLKGLDWHIPFLITPLD